MDSIISELDDASLLARYASTRDEEAFAELVRRYAGLAFQVARRVTGNASDAEDVAQECFVELARRAASVRELPNWLHGVALRRAADGIRSAIARRRQEQVAAAQAAVIDQQPWDSLLPEVDQIISELPELQRVPLILHFLQGLTHGEVAERLGLPRSTVSTRIAEGVQELRRRVGSRGHGVSAAALPALFLPMHAPDHVVGGLTKIGLVGLGSSLAPASLGISGWLMALLMVVGATVAGLWFAWSPPPWVMVAARPALELRELAGVSTHLHLQLADDPSRFERIMLPALRAAGIRHVREQVHGIDDMVVPLLQRLGEQRIRTTMLLNFQINEPRLVPTLAQLTAAEAVEAQNEFDLTRSEVFATPTREDRLRVLRDQVTAVRSALDADDGTRDLPLIAPAWRDESSAAGMRDHAGKMQALNLHTIPDNRTPEELIAERLAWLRRLYPDQPRQVVVSGLGFHSAVPGGIDEDLIGDYTLRALCEAARLGLQRLDFFSLVDHGQDPSNHEDCLGLVAWDGRRKPALAAIAAWSQLLEASTPHPSEAMAVRLSVHSDRLRLLVIDHGDGVRLLALWLATNAAERNTEEAVTVECRDATRWRMRYGNRALVDGPAGEGPCTLTVSGRPLVMEFR